MLHVLWGIFVLLNIPAALFSLGTVICLGATGKPSHELAGSEADTLGVSLYLCCGGCQPWSLSRASTRGRRRK